MADMRRILTAALAVITLAACTPAELRALHAAHTTSSSGGCAGIYNEMRAQGASDSVAHEFAYTIAPRESGCSPRYVHDSDDWSYSRFGLNGLTAGLRATWARWCGADVRSDTRVLSTDVACALAAYRQMGWAPWR